MSNHVDADDIEAERTFRFEIWSELMAIGAHAVPASKVRDLGIYAGQAGVYANKTRTSALTPDGSGVAVSVVHRGTTYADDLSDDGLLYHYPKTLRSSAHDAGEIQALKWAQILGLPIFTITPSAQSPVLVQFD